MTSPEKIRVFIAVDVGAEMRRQMTDLSERLQKGIRFTRAQPKWSDIDNLHLTLNFLGQIDPEQVAPVADLMRRIVENTPPFTYSARGLGVFPNEHRPRVLWVGIKRGAEQMTALQQRLEGRLTELGFAREERPFKPHLTLARMKSNRGAKEMMTVVASHRRVFCGDTRVDRIALYSSERHPDGATYSLLAEAPLLGPEAVEDDANSSASEPDSTSR